MIIVTGSSLTHQVDSHLRYLDPRRIHPTILSIIDSFSHACLYRLHEGKGQKDSFGGTFFPFECVHPIPLTASSFGRAGIHGYIHPIHTEDEVQAAEGEYVMYCCYPEFATRLLAVAKSAPKSFNES